MRDGYTSPLEGRYCSKEMRYLFSEQCRFSTWRRLWTALAETERELGLDISEAQIEELRAHIDDIDFDTALRRESEVRHDVMAHIYAYGVQCPAARPIIHLGATSCFVGDNADIIIMRDALELIERRIAAAARALYDFAEEYKGLATLGYTHFQPAQPTTVGKRASLWLNDLMCDLGDIAYVRSTLQMRGAKGATGTAASFLELFSGDADKVFALDKRIAERFGFSETVPVTGQTYSRKIDVRVLAALSGVAQSACKFANDIRLLQHMKEIEEPFETQQAGSSAMPYKRNPMRCERICSLSRLLINNALNPAYTAATQWLERTLDDSANRRISIAEGFLLCDAVLLLVKNVASGLCVNRRMIEANLARELPFIASETILMDAVKRGGDRQTLHERIRVHSMEAGAQVKNGGANDLLERIAGDKLFGTDRAALDNLLRPEKFIGVSELQTERFLERVKPVLDGYKNIEDTEIRI